ncbi:MAG: sugar phosphate nucleotidyltransferase [Caldicoprobacterales bacterium]|jgi:mannose-1-phosphate guanylyltransferase/phosphomannomutase|nr:NTP transferase domain-containing protein [Clostridiales bacterium]
MKGIIMAGGEGSRLRPLTCDLPKPMVPVMNKPVMAYSVELLKKHGIREIGVTLQYRPEQIMDYFQDGSEYDVRLHYFIEETPLGTAGSVKNAGDFLDQPFVVISGDALTDIDLQRAMQFHKEKDSVATLVLKQVEVPLDYGVVVTNESGGISRFLEKPNWGEVFSDTVNTGIYILEPKVLDYFEAGRKFDFSQDLFPMLLKDQQAMFGYITDEYWCDIGNSQTYLTAHYDMLCGRVNHRFEATERSRNVFVGIGVKIDQDVKLEGPCYIGDYSRIGAGAHIGPKTVIGAHCSIGEEATIKRSVLWNHVILGKRTEIRGAALCSKVKTQNRVSIFEGAVVGEGCQLNEGATVKPQVKIWPNKTIEEASIVQSNLIWGTKISRSLFGKDGISGTANIEISPQTISRIGASLGSFLGPGKKTAVSCDNHATNLMLKYGLISGLMSTGAEVYDLGRLTTPILRYAVTRLALDAGVHLFFTEVGNTRIHVVDSTGNNLSPAAERKIENLYIRDDYPRQDYQDIKQVNKIDDIPIFYIRSLLDAVDVKTIRRKKYRVLVSTSGSRLGSYLLHRILDDLDCDVVKCKDHLEKEMQAGFYDLGCKLDHNGERVILFDERGKQLAKEMQNALISLIYLKDKPEGRIAVPYTAPNIIDKLAREYDCNVVRTKSSKQAIMQETMGTGLFSLYFDGTVLLTRLLERMALDNLTFSSLTREIPDFYVKEKEIHCPWNKKGTVMRSLIEEESKRNGSVEMFEGVRISNDKGWALILPDSEEPICRVYSEGFNEEFAEELAVFYEKRIQEIQSRENHN